MGRLEALCQQRGMRLTRPCRLVLSVLEEARDHPSAQEIHRRAARQRRISLGTVYRILNRLAGSGVLLRHTFGGTMRFEAMGARHHHLLDVNTGRIVEIDSAELAASINDVAERLGYRLIDFKLEITAERKLMSGSGADS